MSEIDKNFSYTEKTKEYMKQKSSGSKPSPERESEPDEVSHAIPKKVIFPKRNKDNE